MHVRTKFIALALGLMIFPTLSTAQNSFVCDETYGQAGFNLSSPKLGSFAEIFSEMDSFVGEGGFVNEANVLRTFFANGYQSVDRSNEMFRHYTFTRTCGSSTARVVLSYCAQSLFTFQFEAEIEVSGQRHYFELIENAILLSRDRQPLADEVYRWTIVDVDRPVSSDFQAAGVSAQSPGPFSLAASYQYVRREVAGIIAGTRRFVEVRQDGLSLRYTVEGSRSREEGARRARVFCQAAR